MPVESKYLSMNQSIVGTNVSLLLGADILWKMSNFQTPYADHGDYFSAQEVFQTKKSFIWGGGGACHLKAPDNPPLSITIKNVSLCKRGNQNNLQLFQVTCLLLDTARPQKLALAPAHSDDKKISEEYFHGDF